MSGLFADLRIGLKSLNNLQTAMSVVNQNIANVYTPGYSRKRVVFQSLPSEMNPWGMIGQGSEILRIESMRDQFLERRILFEKQNFGRLDARNFALRELEGALASGGRVPVAEQMAAFFNGFSDLTNDPSSAAVRQTVLSQGQGLAVEIQRAATRIDVLRRENQNQILDSVDRANALLARVAQLNSELSPLQGQEPEAGELQDQRQVLLNQLAEEIGITTYRDGDGELFVTAGNGRLLVAGGKLFPMETEVTTDGVGIRMHGQDVTSEFRTGRLGAYLELESTQIPFHLESLNTLARTLAEEVNGLHRTGSGLDGSTVLDFFEFDPDSAAFSIRVALQNPQALAAGAPDAGPGDGSVAQAIADLRNRKLDSLNGSSLVESLSEQVFRSGLEARRNADDLEVQGRVLEHLEIQRESVSGVSLDEEAVMLLQYQRAYQANARFIRLIDSLFDELMSFIR